MDTLTSIFIKATQRMQFTKRFLQGPLKYIIIEIILLLLYNYTQGKVSGSQQLENISNNQNIINAISNNMQNLDQDVRIRYEYFLKSSKPHWLAVESWVMMIVIIILILTTILTLIFYPIKDIMRIIMTCILILLLGALRLIFQYRFNHNERTSAIIEVILIQSLLSMQKTGNLKSLQSTELVKNII